jgi:fructose-1,6-bisphosphatase-3
MMVRDTDKGREIREQVNELQKLLVAFRSGLVQERD